ncbi:MAG: signal transduction protein [Ancalomicrobiaceae bacterium]|nr:signal transduction protein [Ancalomicrobiaceae bacterium]
MLTVKLPLEPAYLTPGPHEVLFVTNADLRESANVACWPVEAKYEALLAKALTALGKTPLRAHPIKADKGHGFISSQREGSDVFAAIDPDAPVIVLLTAWQYSHHLANCLARHKGPVLLLANFDGTWPGLVGMLCMAGTLTSLGKPYSRLWSEGFDDALFVNGLKTWLSTGWIEPDLSHLTHVDAAHPVMASEAGKLGIQIGQWSLRHKEIIGLFDAYCMGMMNGVFPLKALADIGMPMEALSQSDLLVEMAKVPLALREECLSFYETRGMTFLWGNDGATELVREQVLEQCAMLIALGRYVDRFGLSAVGVQYQQGLARACAASDFAEGAIGSTTRFPIPTEDGRIVRPGKPIPCVNEVDMGTAIPQTLMFRLLDSLGLPAETTLHDIRWGSDFNGTFYWDFEISGAVPFEQLKGGIAGATGHRQPAMYFPKGGSTIAGQGKAGRIVWARAHYEGTKVKLHVGTGTAVELPKQEFDRRLAATTKEWPLLNCVLDGVTRDQLMAAHQSNHISIAYVDEAHLADVVKAFVAQAITHTIDVYVAGDARNLL